MVFVRACVHVWSNTQTNTVCVCRHCRHLSYHFFKLLFSAVYVLSAWSVKSFHFFCLVYHCAPSFSHINSMLIKVWNYSISHVPGRLVILPQLRLSPGAMWYIDVLSTIDHRSHAWSRTCRSTSLVCIPNMRMFLILRIARSSPAEVDQIQL